MESDNLRTASVYINNLLLSRGLLRDGKTIDFARPDKGEGGMEATMGRVMSIVNDLILRRDRDSAQREALSQTIRTLRSDALRQTTDFERLQIKHIESQRKVGLAEGVERALKTQLRATEQAARGLKEEMGRMRVLVGQTRASCANEVRKRERVIEGLKKHVGEGGRARGSGKAVGVATITVVAGVGGEDSSKALSTEESAYDLRMETNEFLTELARGLSEENENLGGLVRKTVETLKALSGWEREGSEKGGMVVMAESAYDSVANDMDSVIEHLRTLLTNPDFVPLEEVQVREDEIVRLREGWERMEARWREAVQMMDGWRKRMATNGQTVNLEELQMGLRLSPLKAAEIDDISPENGSGGIEDDQEGDTQADIDAMNDSQVPAATDPTSDLDDLDSDDSSAFEEDILDEPMQQREQELSFTSSSSIATPPQLSPLRDVTGRNHNAFTTIVEENTWDLANLDGTSGKVSNGSNVENAPPITAEKEIEADDEVDLLRTSASIPRPRNPSPQKHISTSPRKLASARKPPSIPIPTNPGAGLSRLPRPANLPPPQQAPQIHQSPLTMASIAAKLAATEREADAARVRAKLKAAKASATSSRQTSQSHAYRLEPPSTSTKQERREPSKETRDTAPSSILIDGEIDAYDVSKATTTTKVPIVEEAETKSRKRKAVGRTQGGRSSRRRSTLSPWELESLILGGATAVPVTPAKNLG